MTLNANHAAPAGSATNMWQAIIEVLNATYAITGFTLNATGLISKTMTIFKQTNH